MLASLQGELVLGLARGAFESEHNFLGLCCSTSDSECVGEIDGAGVSRNSADVVRYEVESDDGQ